MDELEAELLDPEAPQLLELPMFGHGRREVLPGLVDDEGFRVVVDGDFAVPVFALVDAVVEAAGAWVLVAAAVVDVAAEAIP